MVEQIKKKLTTDEIDAEIAKVRDFFALIPEELKAEAADHFIYEIVNQGSRTLYEALGIFQEAAIRYREVWYDVMNDVAEQERLKESAQNYRCIEKINRGDGKVVALGEVCQIAFAGDDNSYIGGKKYFVYQKKGSCFDICQGVLETCFELMRSEE